MSTAYETSVVGHIAADTDGAHVVVDIASNLSQAQPGGTTFGEGVARLLLLVNNTGGAHAPGDSPIVPAPSHGVEDVKMSTGFVEAGPVSDVVKGATAGKQSEYIGVLQRLFGGADLNRSHVDQIAEACIAGGGSIPDFTDFVSRLLSYEQYAEVARRFGLSREPFPALNPAGEPPVVWVGSQNWRFLKDVANQHDSW